MSLSNNIAMMNSKLIGAKGSLCFLLIILLISCSPKHSELYVISTDLGDITFEVYPDKAPISVANFRRYVVQAKFDGAAFYRVVRMDNQPVNPVKIEVIQGDFTGKENYFPVIEHETTAMTGLRHKDGTVSMGRFAVGTTAAEFFICINDQPELDKRRNECHGSIQQRI